MLTLRTAARTVKSSSTVPILSWVHDATNTLDVEPRKVTAGFGKLRRGEEAMKPTAIRLLSRALVSFPSTAFGSRRRVDKKKGRQWSKTQSLDVTLVYISAEKESRCPCCYGVSLICVMRYCGFMLRFPLLGRNDSVTLYVQRHDIRYAVEMTKFCLP